MNEHDLKRLRFYKVPCAECGVLVQAKFVGQSKTGYVFKVESGMLNVEPVVHECMGRTGNHELTAEQVRATVESILKPKVIKRRK